MSPSALEAGVRTARSEPERAERCNAERGRPAPTELDDEEHAHQQRDRRDQRPARQQCDETGTTRSRDEEARRAAGEQPADEPLADA